MKKILKILFIVMIVAFTFFSSMNLSYAEENTAVQSTGQITTTVKSASSTENELLSPTNIVNILLIAVGVVLILLATAILLKLKR